MMCQFYKILTVFNSNNQPRTDLITEWDLEGNLNSTISETMAFKFLNTKTKNTISGESLLIALQSICHYLLTFKTTTKKWNLWSYRAMASLRTLLSGCCSWLHWVFVNITCKDFFLPYLKDEAEHSGLITQCTKKHHFFRSTSKI